MINDIVANIFKRYDEACAKDVKVEYPVKLYGQEYDLLSGFRQLVKDKEMRNAFGFVRRGSSLFIGYRYENGILMGMPRDLTGPYKIDNNGFILNLTEYEICEWEKEVKRFEILFDEWWSIYMEDENDES